MGGECVIWIQWRFADDPGMRGRDHIGFTVPDLDEAERFLVDILGAVPVYVLGPSAPTTTGCHATRSAPADRDHRDPLLPARQRHQLELFEYASADGQAPQPRNSDIGGHHLALYVDDIDAALEYLRGHDVEIMGEPVESAGASAGQRWVYFRSPWGMQFELVSYPDGKAYERDARHCSGIRRDQRNEHDPPRTDRSSYRPAPDGHGAAGVRIADALRTAIIAGDYLPGERIRQEELAERYGASRVPVREALRNLEAEG